MGFTEKNILEILNNSFAEIVKKYLKMVVVKYIDWEHTYNKITQRRAYTNKTKYLL